MSYQVLARKYRPRDFHTMAGQSHVLQALINALDSERLHHAYLFTGTRGVGKTTIARIFAKCLNCVEKVSSKPCGVCASCVAIDSGRFVDLIEVDAASRTKVDDTRELLDNVQYAPTSGRFKVYLIDEVHMLSTASFNALLKTLEEPPPRVKFLLATTDPQKLPVTVLSRCLQFNLKALSVEQIANYLAHILELEQISFEQQAVQLLAQAGAGSMRDALSLSDQAIAFGGGKLVTQDVLTMLGSIDNTCVLALFEALIAGDAKSMLAKITELHEQGVNFLSALNELLNLLHKIALAQLVASDDAKVMQLAQKVSAADIQFYYQMGLIGKRDLPLAYEDKAGFEMVLLRMLAFRPLEAKYAPNTELINDEHHKIPSINTVAHEQNKHQNQAFSSSNQEQITKDNLEPKVGFNELEELNKINVDSCSASAPTDAQYLNHEITNTNLNEVKAQQTEGFVKTADNFADDKSSPNLTTNIDANTLPAQNLPHALSVNNNQEQEDLTLEQLAVKWRELLPKLNLNGLTKVLAHNCNLVKIAQTCWHLQLEPECAITFNREQQTKIAQAITDYLQQEIKLEVIIALNSLPTPNQVLKQQQQEAEQLLNQQIHADSTIKQLMQQFSATIEKVEPIL